MQQNIFTISPGLSHARPFELIVDMNLYVAALELNQPLATAYYSYNAMTFPQKGGLHTLIPRDRPILYPNSMKKNDRPWEKRNGGMGRS